MDHSLINKIKIVNPVAIICNHIVNLAHKKISVIHVFTDIISRIIPVFPVKQSSSYAKNANF